MPPDEAATPPGSLAWRIAVRPGLFSIIPLLSIAAVFYNTRLALHLYFLLPVVHFLPGRIDPMAAAAQDE